MANLARVRCTLNGTAIVGPAVTTFYVDEAATGFTADIVTFWDGIKGLIPNTVQIVVPSSGDLIDVANGEITGTWNEVGGDDVIGTDPTGWVEGVGARIKWETSGIRNGRRVRGSTFVVPLGVQHFDSAGKLDAAAVTLGTNEATAFIGLLTPALRIWSRPNGGPNGQSNEVIGGTMPDAVSWLRSRRT